MSTTSSASIGPDLGTYSLGQGVEIPHVRSIDDFIVDRARFEAPPLNDLARWNNRILSNLLYYQTNYFIFFFAVILLLSCFNARDIVLGLFAVSSVVAVGVYALTSNHMFVNTRRDHPWATFAAIGISMYAFFYYLNSVMVLAFSLVFPLFFVLLHASTRLRNFRAKVNQQAERLGLKQTLMGRILDIIGCDVKV